MGIDFSVQTEEWWKTTFERYITGGNNLTTILGQPEGFERHYQMCLPHQDFPDKRMETTNDEWIVTATHPRAGRFELRANRWNPNQWSFNWL